MLNILKKLNLEKIIYILATIIIVGLPSLKLFAYCLNLAGIISNPFIINHVYLLWLVVPFLIVIYITGLILKKFKFNYSDILIIILIILGIISTVFAIDVEKAIIGVKTRNEGILSLISYYMLFLNVKNINNEKYKKNIIRIFLMVGVFQAVYSLLQVYTEFSFIKHHSSNYMAMGLCGNPNFLGSYMVMLTLICTTIYLLDKKEKYFYLSLIFFSGICVACSTGPFLGFILAFIFLIIMYYKKINKKSLIKYILSIVALFVLIDTSVYHVQTNIFGNVIDRKNHNIMGEIAGSMDHYKDGTLGNGRITIWKNSLEAAKNNWLIGAGIENFGNVYPQKKGMYVDKAHNIYLHMLVTNGVFALIAYCALCLIIFIKGFKLKKTFPIALFIAFVGYSIQAFFNISVIDVAPMFFILLGLLHSYYK